MNTTPTGVSFSSNHLELYDHNSNIESYIVPILVPEDVADDTEVSFQLNVANVAKESPLIPNEKDINYELSITATAKIGESYEGEFEVEDTTYTASANLTDKVLTGGIVDRDNYKISMKYADVAKVKMLIMATPAEESKGAVDNKILARKLTFFTYTASEGESSGWTGEIIEGNQSTESSALNYEVTGYGKGTITITWNAEKFEIDPYFLEDMQDEILTNDGKNTKVTFSVDSGTIDYYLIQFYRKQDREDGEASGFRYTYVKSTSETGSSTE